MDAVSSITIYFGFQEAEMDKKMIYNEYILSLSPSIEDEVTSALVMKDFLEFYVEYEVSSNLTTLKFYTSLNDPRQDILQMLTGFYGLEILHHEVVEEKDWLAEWMKTLKPFEYVPGVWINPFAEKQFEPKEGIVLKLIPGTAFGTGHHETTRLIGTVLSNMDCRGASVLDVGTGTGILAILAKKKGAGYTLALDYDPLAVEKAKESIELNDVHVQIRQSDLLKNVEEGEKFDIVTANIVAEIIVMLMQDPKFETVMQDNGYFICSGIIKEKEKMVIDEAMKHELQIIEVVEDGSWAAIVFQKTV